MKEGRYKKSASPNGPVRPAGDITPPGERQGRIVTPIVLGLAKAATAELSRESPRDFRLGLPAGAYWKESGDPSGDVLCLPRSFRTSEGRICSVPRLACSFWAGLW